ncbi:polygalacturonase QRT2-like [Heracleum sosnowskyi]|uniref:Polygalacturonase QRT2-like n=1 Tax=Heracleum sosnowskyi TaxID=360622 RepID=A0AAD8GQV5_9APIA|nr:polygalacturonase QRT2-like [Heracleum sosnowskyi]
MATMKRLCILGIVLVISSVANADSDLVNLKYDRRDLGGQVPAGGGPVIDVSKCPGAKGDGSSDMTQVIMKAWNDACHAPSPSRLLIPAGIWLAGELEFEGPCTAPLVTVEVQGTLKGKPEAAAYPKNYQVYFSRCSFQIVGSGTIDGNGAAAQAIKKASGGKNLPDTVVAIQCPNSGVSGVKIINSKGFHLKVVECDNFKADSIAITSPETTLNTDGIHIARCKGACITNINIATGDDCISIGDAMVDLTIRNIVCAPGHGISIGSLGKFPDEKDVRNVEISNVTLVNTMYGLRIKTIHSGTALAVSNVTYSNIQCKGCGSPIIIDQHYNGGSLTRTPGDSKVRISGVTFKNMKGTTSANVVATLLCSTACGCEGINIQDVSLAYSGTDTEDKGLRTTCENAKATFTGCTIPACK